jgi:zinc protease
MRLRQISILVLVVLGLGTVRPGRLVAEQAAAARAGQNATPRLEHTTFTLTNGLKVILSQDKRLPMVAVNLWYHVGPANEVPGRTGFAHLFEHMMFQGSRHVGSDTHFKLLEAAGASDINGTTNFDRTNYFETVPANQLELALWMESDRMGYLLDVVDEKALANQRDVVRNERRQSLENQPYGVGEEVLYQTLYPAGHPYHGVVIGSHADLAATELRDVQQFFRQYYTPNNASLAIVGDFDPATARKLVEKYFGTLRRGPDVPKIAVTTPPISAEKRVAVTDTVKLPRLYVAWLTPAIFKPGDAEADVAAEILGGGKSSRLFKTLVYDKQIAQAVTVTQESLILGSKFTIEATARPGHTVEELETAINQELGRFVENGPAASELERARNTIETRIVTGLETLGGFGGKADRLNSYEHYLGDPAYLGKDLQRYRDATAGSVKAFAAQYLRPAARVVVTVAPGEKKLAPEPPATKQATEGGAESVNADEPWRKEMPRPGPVRSAQYPTPEQFTLPNGVQVILSERSDLPVVSARLVFASGSGANPADMPGLANFAAAMLDEGTKTRNALQIADEAAQLGATLATGSNMDSTQVSVTSLAAQFPGALDLVADVTLNPTFPQEEVERQRASRLANLVSLKSNPAQIASLVMASALYGTAHPYGYTEIGTDASNKVMSRDAMVGYWKQHLVPGNAALVVVGALSRKELEALAAKAFAGWSGKPSGRTALPAPQGTAAKLVIVDMPGAAQTQVRVAGVGVPRATPDFEAIEVMNALLGGLFTSRINLNLREDKGYSYGAFSVFAFRKEAGPFYAGAGVRTDATAPSVTEIYNEIRKMKDVEVTVDELTLGRDSLVRSMPGRFETTAQAADSFATLFVYGLGLDYYSKYIERVAAIDSGAVRGVARKYLLPERMLVVAVGDRQKIEADLMKLNLGPVELRDADGNVVKP